MKSLKRGTSPITESLLGTLFGISFSGEMHSLLSLLRDPNESTDPNVFCPDVLRKHKV